MTSDDQRAVPVGGDGRAGRRLGVRAGREVVVETGAPGLVRLGGQRSRHASTLPRRRAAYTRAAGDGGMACRGEIGDVVAKEAFHAGVAGVVTPAAPRVSPRPE